MRVLRALLHAVITTGIWMILFCTAIAAGISAQGLSVLVGIGLPIAISIGFLAGWSQR